jgi:NADH-quinone oxidoreductase subunit E
MQKGTDMGAAEASRASESPDINPALQIIAEMAPVTSSDIIPLLQRLQNVYGYLPREVVLDVCGRTGLPASRVFGVATFYSQFYLEPRGRRLVRCCRGTACHVRGSRRILGSVERALGIRDGETTADMQFSLETIACLGTCFLAPVVMVDRDYYGNVTADQVNKILKHYR